MSKPVSLGPVSRNFQSQALNLHYLEWGDKNAPVLVLLHGGADHAHSWDELAATLSPRWRVIAPDLRGHGDSDWSPDAAYSILDYVTDLKMLWSHCQLQQATIVAHSMGGKIALHFAAAYPEAILKLIAIEGVDMLPPSLAPLHERPAAKRLRYWIDERIATNARQARHYPSLEDALKRMISAHPQLPADVARHLTIHGTRRNDDGSLSWKFDNHIRAVSAVDFRGREYADMLGEIRCPVLLVNGKDSWVPDPVATGRIDDFRAAQAVTLAGAGHWVQHDQPAAFLAALEHFI